MMRQHGRWSRNRGQALILAIIVMILLAVLSAAMIAIVSRGLDEGTRDESRVRARLLAEAGLKFADEMLTSSPQGADWRPALPAWQTPGDVDYDQDSYDLTWDSYELLRGWDPQHVRNQQPVDPVYFVKYRFASDPDAQSTSTELAPQDDPGQDFVDPAVPIRPIENVEETAPHDHFLLRIEWAPGRTLPGGGIDPLSKYLKVTAIGRPGEQLTAFSEMVAYKAVGVQDYLLFIHDRDRAGTSASLGLPFFDIDGDGSTTSSNRAADTWASSGPNDVVPLWLRGPVRANLNTRLQAPVRIDPNESPTGWHEQVEIAGSLEQTVDPASRPGGAASGNSQVLIQNPDGTLADFADDNTAAISANGILAPSGNAWPAALQVGAQREIEAPALETFEELTGVSRWDRLTRLSGDDITINVGGSPLQINSGELGYGRGIYVDNDSQRDQLTTAPNRWALPSRWGGRRFVPNGCIIELLAHYPNPLDTSDPPAIAITRTDGSTWLSPGAPAPGSSTGQRTMVFQFPNQNGGWGPATTLPPHPDNGIILCEGNVRIFGNLPTSDPANGLNYNLTVVSRGSIFVDGPILRPSDYADVGVNSPRNTRLALLARDHIVLNPTTLAPGMVPGMPPAPFTVPAQAPDDAHWSLDPNGTTAIGIRAAIADPGYNGNRHLYVEQADGNVNDAVTARSAVIVHKTRATLGLTPILTSPATLAEPWLASVDGSSLPGVPGRNGVGLPVFFADWANLDRALYQGETREYAPDAWGIPHENFNDSRAAEEPGVPSYLTVQGGLDLTDASVLAGRDSRSDVIVKNMKLDRWGDSDPLRVRPGLDFVVAALMYAERGGFYVVPGGWFDPRVQTLADVVQPGSDTTPDEAAARFARLKRYNYRIQIRGAISVNQMPSLDEVGAWTEQWAYPPDYVGDERIARTNASAAAGVALFNDYDAVQYDYDWGLRTVGPRPNVPRLPSLPASPGWVYVGEDN